MPKSLTISSEESGFPEYLDWEKLRQQGIRHIADLSGKIWTDHNTHDPGITILEMLCYALTDLGYRTNFEIEDLLARKDKNLPEDNFITAAEILGCNPLIPLDYRKLLIDIEGVRNAWLEPAEETPIPDAGSYLVADLIDADLQIVQESEIDAVRQQRIQLKGFYRVYLELEHVKATINRHPGTPIVNQETILHKVKQTLSEHRNFCEDFLEVIVLRDEEIGICADLELIPDADPDSVLQDLYSTIQEFLSPSIQFYSLSEMLDKKKTPEQIFAGRPPRSMSHGFIDTDELSAMQRRTKLYGSDLYQVILKDPRIRAIRELSMSNYWIDENASTKSQEGEQWILELHPELHRPILSPERCSIQMFKSQIPLATDGALAATIFENRLSNFDKAISISSDLDFPIPQGTYRELEDYFSIQHEFPLVYGIGEGQLSAEASGSRTSKARQLQAYLTFYDQLLADYLAQLAHIRELFSYKTRVGHKASYFTQPLVNTPEGARLIRFFNTAKDEEPIPDLHLPYSKEETIAYSAKVTDSPEERDELIRLTVLAFAKRSAKIKVATEGKIKGNKYLLEPWVIQSQADEDLLVGSREFAVEIEEATAGQDVINLAKNKAIYEAKHEAKALLLMRLSSDQFRKRDNNILMPNGEYEHEYSFRLAFEPNGYSSTLEALIEKEENFEKRRDHFLDHLLARFSEEFTDYTLLMYALNGQRLALPEIIGDKEKFLQNYPNISRNRGRAFDYTDLRLAEICNPRPLSETSSTQEEEEKDNGALETIYQLEEEGETGEYRFQLISLNTLQPLFISYRGDYTQEEASMEAQRIIGFFVQPDLEAEVQYELRSQSGDSRNGGNENCIIIVRKEVRTFVVADPTAGEDPIEQKNVESIIAIYVQNDQPTEVSAASRTPVVSNLVLSSTSPDPFEVIKTLFQDDRVSWEAKIKDNTSGLERRVAALMGLDDWDRKQLNYLKLSLDADGLVCLMEMIQNDKAEGGVASNGGRQEDNDSNHVAAKAYGFRVLHAVTKRVLLESIHKDYTWEQADTEATKMIKGLKVEGDQASYWLQDLPYSFRGDFQTTDHVIGIGVIRNKEDRQVQIAVHPETFLKEEERNTQKEIVQQAIKTDLIEVETFLADTFPLFTLCNDTDDTILTGFINRQEVEEIENAVELVEEGNKEDERNRLLREKLNEFLRGFGNGEVNPIFYVDVFHEEYYDFHFVHSSYHLATHPGLYQHKLERERALRRMQAYVRNRGNNPQSLMRQWAWERGPDDQQKAYLSVLKTGTEEDLLISEEFYSAGEAADIILEHSATILTRAGDRSAYQIVGIDDQFKILLEVPLGQDQDILRLWNPNSFTSDVDAGKKIVDIIRLADSMRSVNNVAFFLWLTDQQGTSSQDGIRLQSPESFTETEARVYFEANFFRIIETAREYDQFQLLFNDDTNRYEIALEVPMDDGQVMTYPYAGSFEKRVEAEQKADDIRQKARLYPVARRDQGYIFFMYPDELPPAFGEDRDRVKRRREWNVNWEDRIFWESVKVFDTVEEAFGAYAGGLPTSNALQFNNNPANSPRNPSSSLDDTSFIALLTDPKTSPSIYNRTEPQDERGSRDDIGPFTLEIVDPSQVLAGTLPISLKELEEMSDEDFARNDRFGDAADVGFYRVPKDRDTAFKEIEKFLFLEGFHVVEHILLSPIIQAESPAGVQAIYRAASNDVGATLEQNLVSSVETCPAVDPDDLPLREDQYVPLLDPFSGWATVVLPFWPKRFQNMRFREFFESTLRREAPAHVALRIIWVDPIDLDKFEECYNAWLKALYLHSDDSIRRRNDLMEAILNMTNVYPDANLPVGSNGESDGSVVLDFTKLI